jgi:hypothetical protein
VKLTVTDLRRRLDRKSSIVSLTGSPPTSIAPAMKLEWGVQTYS